MKLYQVIAQLVSQDKPDQIDRLVKKFMPYGSGFDSGSRIDHEQSTSNKLVFNTSFRHMDESGYYNGWSDHTIVVTPDLMHTVDIAVSGDDTNDINDYVHEQFSYALNVEINYNFKTGEEFTKSKL